MCLRSSVNNSGKREIAAPPLAPQATHTHTLHRANSQHAVFCCTFSSSFSDLNCLVQVNLQPFVQTSCFFLL